MFDKIIQKNTNKNLMILAQLFKFIGFSANSVTALGLFSALICFLSICFGYLYIALLFILINRFLDGIDGALARLNEENRFGSFFDITSDLTFYSIVPLGFAFLSPDQNSIPTVVILFSFCINSSSFLAKAIIVEKYSIKADKRGKGFFYSKGVIEGSETALFFSLICLFPNYYPFLAYVFAALTLLTHILRVFRTRQEFN